jgi:hypothetical protein
MKLIINSDFIAIRTADHDFRMWHQYTGKSEAKIFSAENVIKPGFIKVRRTQ